MSVPVEPVCPLCKIIAGESVQIGGRTFVHCALCDLIHVPVAQHLDHQAEQERYLRHENRIVDGEYVATFDGVLDWLSDYAPNARRVLDFGSGPTPVLVELLRRRGYDAMGYDPYFSDSDWPGGVFDAIVSVETFEHLRDPTGELRRLRASLATGAPLIVKTQFHSGFDSLDGWYYIRDKTHVAFYSPATLAWIAGAFDLKLVRHDGVSLACLQAVS